MKNPVSAERTLSGRLLPRGGNVLAVLLLLALTCPPGPAWAQDAPPARPVKLFQWRFVGEVALGTAGSLVLLPLDGRVRSWMQAPARQESGFLDHVASAATPFGASVPMVATVALYGIGLVAGSPTAADVGLHTGEAIAGAGVTTLFLKALVGRRRPYVDPHDPHGFGKGRALDFDGRFESFPSGHATVAFAVAGALTEETAQHWPGKQRVVAPVVYATAATVAFARVYRDRHWASDVLAGAVVGTLVSRRVVRSLHTGGAGPFSRLNPILLPRGGGGTTVGLSVALH